MIAAVAFAALGGIGVFVASVMASRPAPPRAALGPSGVVTRCERAVAERLVSPGSMRRVGASTPALERGSWSVVVEVDSQNAFGALLRSRWGCRVDDATGVVTDARQLD